MWNMRTLHMIFIKNMRIIYKKSSNTHFLRAYSMDILDGTCRQTVFCAVKAQKCCIFVILYFWDPTSQNACRWNLPPYTHVRHMNSVFLIFLRSTHPQHAYSLSIVIVGNACSVIVDSEYTSWRCVFFTEFEKLNSHGWYACTVGI